MKMPYRATAALAACLVLPAATARAAEYTFTRVADDAGLFDTFGFPAINNLGQVAFRSALDNGTSGIYRVDVPGVVTTIADSTGPLASFINMVSLNNTGSVAFEGELDNRVQGLFVGNGATPAAEVYRAGGPQSFSGFHQGAQLSDDNQLAFFASGTGLRPSGIFRGNGTTTTAIAEESSNVLVFVQAVRANDLGTVTFTSAGLVNGEAVISLRAGNGTTTTTVVDTTGPLKLPGEGAVNNLGTVLFNGDLDSGGGTGLHLGSTSGDGAFTTIIDTNNSPFKMVLFPALNNRDGIAFLGLLDDDRRGVFTGPDADADKVVAVGDPLFGSTVETVAFFRDGINDLGQIAFVAGLADGQSVVGIATPVPEPATVGALATAAALLTLRRRW